MPGPLVNHPLTMRAALCLFTPPKRLPQSSVGTQPPTTLTRSPAQVLGRVTDSIAAAAALVKAELNSAIPPPAVLQRPLLPPPSDELSRALADVLAAVKLLHQQSQERQECSSAAGGFVVRICLLRQCGDALGSMLYST
jgi:hypothetical protein